MRWNRRAQWLCALVGAIGLMTTQASAQTSAAPRGALEGTVLTDPGDRPVVGALVELAEFDLRVKTDSAGNFTLKNVPIGAHAVVVRADGFNDLETVLTFNPNETLSRDFLITRENDVRLLIGKNKQPSAESMRLSDFESRRKLASGRFIARQVFEKAGGTRRFSELLTTGIPGILLVSNNGERSVATGNRGQISASSTPGEPGKTKRCYVQVIMDNIVRYRSTPGEKLFNIDQIDANMVVGVEFYTVSQTPIQFNSTGGAPCGTLIIWTQG